MSSNRTVKLGDALRWTLWSAKVVGRGAVGLAGALKGPGLAEAMQPWKSVPVAIDIDYGALASEGVEAVLFDLENTLIPPGGPFTADGRAIVEAVRSAGLKIAVVSNCSASWVKPCLDSEQIPFVAPAGKPGARGFLKASGMLGVDAAKCVYVGDQVITDVIGAQRAGMRAILLEPFHTTEALSSKGQRLLVRAVQLAMKGKRT